MILLKKSTSVLILLVSILLIIPTNAFSQKRIKPPKRNSKIKSVDLFVGHTFKLYNKVFVYDSLTKANVEIPTELEDALTESAERDIDSLLEAIPDIIEDISDASFMRQAKATLNLNKAKKALKRSVLMFKNYFIESKDEDEDEEDEDEDENEG